MTYEQAQEVSKELSKHNSFVRTTTKQQQQASRASTPNTTKASTYGSSRRRNLLKVLTKQST